MELRHGEVGELRKAPFQYTAAQIGAIVGVCKTTVIKVLNQYRLNDLTLIENPKAVCRREKVMTPAECEMLTSKEMLFDMRNLTLVKRAELFSEITGKHITSAIVKNEYKR